MPASQPKPRLLSEPMRAYRIGDPNGIYPIYSGEGAAKTEGRWHERGQEVIYASRYYSTAMLEKLAHFNGIMPIGQHYLEIEIPRDVSYEVVTKDSLARWTVMSVAQAFGSLWFSERRSAILIVPSFVARLDENVIINCAHVDAKLIRPGLEAPIVWDARLYGPNP